MKEIKINLSLNASIIEQVSAYIEGDIVKTYSESTLKFDNSIGKGTIRTIVFEWGISLLDYDVHFYEDIKFVYEISNFSPVEFLFVSEGQLSYASKRSGKDSNLIELQRYQNTILSNLPNSNNIFVFPKGKDIKLNVIQLKGEEYSNKKNNYIHTLQNSLKSIITGQIKYLPYKHLGNFNLKLADIIESLNDNNNEGIIRSLNIEGQLNLILALQILEHKSYEDKFTLPNSISKNDLVKTKEISQYINDNVQDSFTVAELASIHGISPKKIQTGFKLLYGKSVNEYVRLKKLELSRELIETTEYSISEIVYQIGYKSRSYFSKIFSENYDILPVEYKELVRRNKTTSKRG